MYNSTINSIIKSVQKCKSARLDYYPAKISIETGNLCNLRCPLCPTANADQAGIDRGMLKFNDFKTIFDKIAPFAKTIDLFSWGEPFLNKRIGDMIAYARKESPALRMFIDSNLNIVNDDQIDSIVRHKLDVLKVSCDGFSQEAYKKYRVGGDVNDVLENVRKILAKKKELSSEYPKVIWKYIVFKHNVNEVALARDLAGKMGIAFEVSGMRIDCGKEIFEKVEESVTRDKEWIPEGTEFNNYSDLTHAPEICEKPWRTMTINFNGDVVPCGAIYDCGKYNYGNMIKESFDDIWNNDKYVKARNIITGKCGSDPNLICSICKDKGYQYF